MKPIVFFDGECYLCNGFVDMIMHADRQNRLALAPLQGSTFKSLNLPHPVTGQPFDNIFLYENEKFYDRSDAIFRILSHLGGPWKLFNILRIIPKFIRDSVYIIIAKNRYSWFGKRDSCRIPTPEEKEHFLP